MNPAGRGFIVSLILKVVGREKFTHHINETVPKKYLNKKEALQKLVTTPSTIKIEEFLSKSNPQELKFLPATQRTIQPTVTKNSHKITGNRNKLTFSSLNNKLMIPTMQVNRAKVLINKITMTPIRFSLVVNAMFSPQSGLHSFD